MMPWPGYDEHPKATDEPTAAEYREALALCVEPLSEALSVFSHEVNSWGERAYQHCLYGAINDVATALDAVKNLLARGTEHD